MMEQLTIVLFCLGLCLGSFVNALVYRLYEQSKYLSLINLYSSKHKSNKKIQKENLNLSIWTGRSICPKCKHQLSVLDLIPVVSWVLLKGRCRYCKKPISAQYPIVEFLVALLFVFSYIFWPLEFNNFGTMNFIFWLIYLIGFMTLIVYDTKWMILPDKIVLPLIILASIQVLVNILIFNKGFSLATTALMSVLVSSGFFLILFQISKGKWIGGGDVKLGIVLGLILADPLASLLMLFTASLLGIIAVIPTLLKGKLSKNKQIPFGPFLIIATIIVYLFGLNFIYWYKTTFLLM